MSDIQAIDTMNRPYYVRPELMKPLFETREYQVLAETTFAGVRDRHDLGSDELWRVFEVLGNSSVKELLADMDENGVESVFMDQTVQWSRDGQEEMVIASVDELAELRDESDGRIIPGVGYNPFEIEESLDRVERAVEDHDFKYVWFHPNTFGLRASNEKCYPLYTKCRDLDVPVCFQTGHSAEPLPSEPGHPMYADEVAMDFPNLTMVLTHTGWPWPMEWCSMLWRHPNVYGNIGASFPSFMPKSPIEFIDGRIRDSVLWATNGIGLGRHKQEFLDLDIAEETKRKVLRENALDVFDV
jgi:predicted TIM-barrel fold metal-dependent hydrolase